MPVNIENEGSTSKVVIDGEMTIYTAQELKESLQPHLKEAKEIEIDLSQVTEMDGAGLQLMLATKLESIANGSQLRFTAHSNTVLDVLTVTDLVRFFGDPIVMPAEVA